MKENELKKTIITIPEVKEILEKIDLETADQIQRRTLEYTTKFSKMDAKKARKLKKKLVEECGLTIEEASELVNVVPTSVEELRVFAAGWRKLLTTETTEKILKILLEEKE